MTAIPIGIDYHTIAHQKLPIEQEKELIHYGGDHNEPNLLKCYGNFQFSSPGCKYFYDRIDAMKLISSDCIDYQATYLPRLETWKEQTKYAFMIKS